MNGGLSVAAETGKAGLCGLETAPISSDPDEAPPSAPGIDGLKSIRNGHDLDAGLTQPFFLCREQVCFLDLQRKPGQTGGGIVAAASAGALPDVETEMVVIAAGG